MSRSVRLQEVPEIPVAPIIHELTGEEVYEAEPGERWKKISCPFHDDRTPSASISYLGFHCFSCEREGDAYKLLMTETGCDFNGALQRAKEITGIQSGGSRRKKRRSSMILGYSYDA